MTKDAPKSENKNYSNRFLKKKIEILFDNTFKKNIIDSPEASEASKEHSAHQSQSKPEQILVKKKKRIFLLNYFFILILIPLLWLGLWGLGVRINTVGSWDLVYWWTRLWGGQQPITEIYLNKKYTLKSAAPIYATPAIADLNGDRSLDFVFANTLGDVYAIDGTSGKKIYHFASGGAISASINFVELKKQKLLATLVVNENGDFFTLNAQGDYFYDLRKELIQGSLRTKPVVNPQNKDIYLVTAKGAVVCLDSNYGFVKWKNENALYADQVFATPFLIDLNRDGHLDLIVVSLAGNLCALNGKDGTILWLNRLFTRVKSSPLILDLDRLRSGHVLSGNKVLFIVSTRGEVYLLSLKSGEVLKKQQLPNKGYIVSTPVEFINADQRRLALTTEAGEILICDLSAAGNLKILLNRKIADCYFSSPLICDLDGDQFAELILVSRQGLIQILSSKKNYQPLATPFELGYKVTATPLLADLTGDRQLELICSGEEGTVTVLQLTSKPKMIFPKRQIMYGEFLNRD